MFKLVQNPRINNERREESEVESYLKQPALTKL